MEGVAAPEQAGDELDDPGFDPGGDTDLPFETAPAPAAPDDAEDTGDGAPLDVEPGVDLDARLAPLADTGAPGIDEPAGVPPAEVAPPVGASPPDGSVWVVGEPPPGGAGTPGEPSDRGADALPPGPTAEQGKRAPRAFGFTRAPSTHEDGRSDFRAPASTRRVTVGDGVPAGQYTAPVPAAPVPAADSATVAQVDVASQTTSQDLSLESDTRFYVVQPGDSLWSIAKQLVGNDASAGRIAREVNRLWSLNRARIATGDPDLLMVGTRLELR